jgi:hypothetical protein
MQPNWGRYFLGQPPEADTGRQIAERRPRRDHSERIAEAGPPAETARKGIAAGCVINVPSVA